MATVALVARWRAGWAAPARDRRLLGLSPVLLIAEVGGVHNDAPALLCLVAAAWCLVRGRGAAPPPRWTPRPARSPSLAAAIKPLARDRRAGRRARARRGAVRARRPGRAAGVVAGLVVLAAFGGATPDLATQASLVTPLSRAEPARARAPVTAGRTRRCARAARAILEGVVVLASARVVLRRDRALPAMAVVLVAAVLTLPWVMPWYLVWALPFLALAPRADRGPVALAAAVWLSSAGCRSSPRSCTGPATSRRACHRAAESPGRGAPAAMRELARIARFCARRRHQHRDHLPGLRAAGPRRHPRPGGIGRRVRAGAANGYQLNRRWTFRAPDGSAATSRCRRSAPSRARAGVALARGDGCPRLAAECVILPA